MDDARLTLDDFDYALPPELIAQSPATTRTGSRLLHVDGATLADLAFPDVVDLVAPGDVVVMNDDLRRLPELIDISRRTHAVLWQNIAIALGIKAAVLVLALAGNATMWMAVFADMGASLLVVFNGLRLLRR